MRSAVNYCACLVRHTRVTRGNAIHAYLKVHAYLGVERLVAANSSTRTFSRKNKNSRLHCRLRTWVGHHGQCARSSATHTENALCADLAWLWFTARSRRYTAIAHRNGCGLAFSHWIDCSYISALIQATLFACNTLVAGPSTYTARHHSGAVPLAHLITTMFASQRLRARDGEERLSVTCLVAATAWVAEQTVVTCLPTTRCSFYFHLPRIVTALRSKKICTLVLLRHTCWCL